MVHELSGRVARAALVLALLLALPAAAQLDPKAVEAEFQKGVVAYDGGDYATAFNVWLPLAREGDPAAQRNIGHLYRQGLGIEQNFEEAARWYVRAAESGLTGAQVNLAMMYVRGQGVMQNHLQAAKWFHQAAVAGHVIAQYNLGLMYAKGMGIRQDLPRAMGWLYLSAKAGHKGAIERLSQLVLEAPGPSESMANQRRLEAPLEQQTAEQRAANAGSPPPARQGDAPLADLGSPSDQPADPAAASELPLQADGAATAGQAATAAPAAAPGQNRTAAETAGESQSGGFFGRIASIFSSSEKSSPTASLGEARGGVETRTLTLGDDDATESATQPQLAESAATTATRPEAVGLRTAPPRAASPPAAPATPVQAAPVAPVQAAQAASAPPQAAAAAPAASAAPSRPSQASRVALARYAGNLDEAEARWRPAAQDGEAEAQYQLGLLYADPDYARHDRTLSYMWLTLASEQWHQGAREALDALTAGMSSRERLQGRRLLDEWRAGR